MVPRSILPHESTLVTEWVGPTSEPEEPLFLAVEASSTTYTDRAKFSLRQRANGSGPGGFSNKDIGIFLGSILGFIVLLLISCCFCSAGRLHAGLSSDEESSDDSGSSKPSVSSRNGMPDVPLPPEAVPGRHRDVPQTFHDDDSIVGIVESRPETRPRRTKPGSTKGTKRGASTMEEVRPRPRPQNKPEGKESKGKEPGGPEPGRTRETDREASATEEKRPERVATSYGSKAAAQNLEPIQISEEQRKQISAGQSVPIRSSGKLAAARRRRKVRQPKGGKNLASPPRTETGDPPPPPPPPPPAPDAA